MPPAPPAPPVPSVLSIPRLEGEIYGDMPWGKVGILTHLLKAQDGAEPGGSSVKSSSGRKAHPFDMGATAILRNSNGYHSTCLETKIHSTAGLGFKSEKVEDALRPLASVGGLAHCFHDVLMPVVSDLVENGNGYMEVVRSGPGGPITGLYHVEADRTYVCVESNGRHVYYEVTGCGNITSGDKKFAKFGDSERFLQAHKDQQHLNPTGEVSEIIHFRRPSSLSRYYGWPDWLAAVAAIELMQMSHRFEFDFFLNRGVPEFMLFLLGINLADGDWKTVQDALKAQIGLGKSHKSIALNIKEGISEHSKVQLEKLGLDEKAGTSGFGSMHEVLALEIVSAHRIPPLLAGIVIPGKLGANNELPNALMATQALVVGPLQRLLISTLESTLGDPSKNGGLDLGKGDFELNTILDEIDLAAATTVAGMKQPLAEANAEGRDLAEGMKKALTDEQLDAAAVLCSKIVDMAVRRRSQPAAA